MRPLLLLLMILSQGCSMLQSRREMMVEACLKDPTLSMVSYDGKRLEWKMACKDLLKEGAVE